MFLKGSKGVLKRSILFEKCFDLCHASSIRYFGFVQMPDPPPHLRSNAQPSGHTLVSNSHLRRHESRSYTQGDVKASI